MKKPNKAEQQKPEQNRIPEEVHREASRIAKNLMKLPPNPSKRK